MRIGYIYFVDFLAQYLRTSTLNTLEYGMLSGQYMTLDGDADCTEANLGPHRTSMMEFFAKIVNGF